jgi:copper(I)-binding protein
MSRRAQVGRLGVVTTTLLLACTPTDDTRAASDALRAGPLIVREAWARPADSGTTAGAYLTLKNDDTTAHVITTITSPDAAAAELHTTMQHDGMAHMMAQPTVTIPRDSTLVMAPGGLHVMLHATTRTLKAGDTLRLALTVDQNTLVPVAVVVRAP